MPRNPRNLGYGREDLSKRHLPQQGLAASGLLLLILCSTVLAADETVDVLTIADSIGDWGFPSPYGHYSRGPGYIRMSLIFDTLVWKDELGFVPALAEEWEYLPSEKAYLFNLRKGVTWNDGVPFTAKDVVFTFDYSVDHPYQWVDSSIVEKAEAMDDSTVKITLKKDYAPFLDLVAGTQPIIPEHVYKGIADPEGFQDPAALTGTGPFTLVDYNKAQGTYLYKAYDGYYQGSPKVKQIKFVKVSDQIAASALENGDVDAASVQGDVVEDLKRAGFAVIEGGHDFLLEVAINHKKELLSEAKFRQALAYSVDRQALVDTALRGYGLAGSPGLYPSDSIWYNPAQEQYAYDPAKAAGLLQELGYVKEGQYFSKDGKPIELEMLLDSSRYESAGEMIKQQLESAGFKINLRSVESKTLDSLVGDWKFELALTGYGGLGGDPNILNWVIIGENYNSARFYEDPVLTDLLERQIAEMDPAKRKDLVFQAEELIARDLPALPLYYTDSYWASDDKVTFYFTYGGVGSGVPIALNKMIFI